MRSNNLKRHLLTHKKKKDKVEEKKVQKRPNRKSTNFFLTFQKPIKYHIVKKLHIHMGNNWVKGLTVGNEWGAGYLPHGHCHAVLTVGEPGYSYENLKKILKEDYKLQADVGAVRNVRSSVEYISKQDYKCVSQGHPKDYLSVLCKAYLYSLKYSKFKPTDYPYCAMGPWQKRDFKEYLNEFYEEQEIDRLNELMADITLREWQQKAVMAFMMQNDRHVLWIYDQDGGKGKTTLAKYLVVNHQAVILHNGSTADIALTYDKQKYVVFDYTRTEEKINYRAIEHLKNGLIFSSKYQSSMKSFPSPKVMCLANDLPDVNGLSKDRWHILEFDAQGRLRRHHV